MKKFFFFAIAAFGMMVGCQKQNYVEPTLEETEGPVAVSFNANVPSLVLTKTKAGGVDKWTDQNLFVYGFPRSTEDYTKAENQFIDNVQVQLTSTNLRDEVIGSETRDDVIADLVPKQTLEDGSEESYYYAVDNTTYDFYGYYVDNAASEVPTKSADKISLPFTITGTQDIMLAKANQIEDVKGTGVDPSRAYSAYSARKQVVPTLEFQHQLARFKFFVVAGSSTTTEEGKKVSVTGITIEKAKVSADLVIVGEERGIKNVKSEDADLATLTLTKNGVDALEPVYPAAYDQTNPVKTQVGESIMVIPDETEYTLKYTLAQEGVTQDVSPESGITLNINNFGDEAKAAGKFLAGKEYHVTLTVYGLEEVVITAELAKWEHGGDYDYDPDEDWEDEEISVPGSAYVYDDLSWTELPVSYRNDHPWDDATYDTFPWLATWCKTLETQKLNIVVAHPAYTTVDDSNAEVTVPAGEAPMTGWTQPFDYTKPANPESVFIFNEDELGMEIVPGTWTITVYDESKTTKLHEATVTVPEK